MQAFGLGFQLLKPSFGVNVDGILGVLADVELELELLWRSGETFAKTFQTHVGRTPQLERIMQRGVKKRRGPPQRQIVEVEEQRDSGDR